MQIVAFLLIILVLMPLLIWACCRIDQIRTELRVRRRRSSQRISTR